MKKENKEKKSFGNHMICYAMFEIFAEYKRYGISKAEMIKLMFSFNLFFFVKELLRRKKASKRDILSCKKAALEQGLIQTAGTKTYPIFKKLELK